MLPSSRLEDDDDSVRRSRFGRGRDEKATGRWEADSGKSSAEQAAQRLTMMDEESFREEECGKDSRGKELLIMTKGTAASALGI